VSILPSLEGGGPEARGLLAAIAYDIAGGRSLPANGECPQSNELTREPPEFGLVWLNRSPIPVGRGWGGGGNFLVQMIFTCLPSPRGKGGGGRHPMGVSCLIRARSRKKLPLLRKFAVLSSGPQIFGDLICRVLWSLAVSVKLR
jgi:hypothetical protein